MAKDASFDIVSEYDKQEMLNAVEQTRKEISTRFDLKDSGSDVEYKEGDKLININAGDDFQLRNILDILENKLVKRNLSPLLLDPKPAESALGGRMKQTVNLKYGISQENAKKIVAKIKESKLKVQASIQGEQVRVTGKSKDDLQDVIALLKSESEAMQLPLQFTNYR